VCVLIVGVRWLEDLPLVVAASRDEAYARPATTPAAAVLEGMRVLRPRDEQAGGTWIGTNAAGLVVVITNRRDGDFDPRRRSRGLLCSEVLAQPDGAAAARRLEQGLERELYNSFNLLIADPSAVRLATWNGDLQTVSLGAGAHVLSNEHVLGELVLSELQSLPVAHGPDVRELLLGLLASHVPRDARGFRICKHGGTHGTVSASLIYRRRDGSTLMEHAPGPACTTPFGLHVLR